MPLKDSPTTLADRASIWTGTRYFDLAHPNPAEVDLHDIAIALARLPRFTGHGCRIVTVAEHSALVVSLAVKDGVRDYDMLAALFMHDAQEAYLGDVSSPLKAHLPDYRALERGVQEAIAVRFDLVPYPDAVRTYDLEALAIEKALVFPGSEVWPGIDDTRPRAFEVPQWTPFVGASRFLEIAELIGVS